MTDQIRARIQELCPDVKMPDPFLHEVETVACKFINKVESGKAKSKETYRDMKHLLISAMQKDFMPPITLAVTLRALAKMGTVTKGANALINIIDVNAPDIRWNLVHDNYDQQREETKRFIGSLLGHEA